MYLPLKLVELNKIPDNCIAVVPLFEKSEEAIKFANGATILKVETCENSSDVDSRTIQDIIE